MVVHKAGNNLHYMNALQLQIKEDIAHNSIISCIIIIIIVSIIFYDCIVAIWHCDMVTVAARAIIDKSNAMSMQKR